LRAERHPAATDGSRPRRAEPVAHRPARARDTPGPDVVVVSCGDVAAPCGGVV